MYKPLRLLTFPKSLLILVFLLPSFSHALPAVDSFTLDGRLYNSADPTQPLLDATASVTIQILNPSETCVLYEQTQTVNTLATSGKINIEVGSAVGSPLRSGGDSGHTMIRLFTNSGTIVGTGGGCGGGYTPVVGDARKLRITVTPTAGSPETLSPSMTLTSVANAMVADTVQGLPRSGILELGAQSLTQANVQNIFSTANYPVLTSLLAGTNTQYLRATATGTPLPSFASNPSGTTAGQIWYDSVSNVIKYDNGTTVQTLATGNGLGFTPVNVAGDTMTGTLNLPANGLVVGTTQLVASGGNIGVGTATPTAKLQVANGNATALLVGADGAGATITDSTTKVARLAIPHYLNAEEPVSLIHANSGATENYMTIGGGTGQHNSMTSIRFFTGANSTTTNGAERVRIDSAGNVGIGTDNPSTKLEVAGTLKVADGSETCSAAANGGMIRYSGTSLQFCNGSSWQTLGISGAGMTSLGGQIGSTQTFSAGATGTAPAIASSGNVHTLNVPLASGAGVTSGTISKTDYDAFAAKLGTATTFAGDVSGTYNATVVDKIKGTAVSATAPSASGHVLRYDGTTNYVPAFLSLADIRSTVTPANTMFPATACTSSQTLTWSSLTDTMTCSPIVVASANITDGTIVAADLATSLSDNLWTGASGHVYRATGDVGIGTTAAATKLHVVGTVKVADGGETCSVAANGGMIRYSGTALQFCNGSSWQTLGISGAGVTSLGGQTGSTQTFSAGATGTAPAIASSGDVHTLNVPLASGAGVTSGTISKTDYDAFAAKLGTATTFAGDVSGTYNATVVDKIKGTAVSATAPSVAGQVLRYDGTTNYVPAFLSLADIRSTVTPGNTMFPATACTASKTLTWSSLTDTMTCSDIVVASANITDGTIVAADLATSLSDHLWSGASGNVHRATGNVGIGSTTPTSKLHVAETRTDTTAVWPSMTRSALTASPASASLSNFMSGHFSATTGTNEDIAGLYGLYGTGSHGHTGVVTDIQGIRGTAFNNAGGTVTSLRAGEFYADNASTGAVTDAMGLRAAVYKNGAGAITNGYGVYIGAVAGTNNWSLYASSASAPSYFAGNVGIGTNAPNQRLTVNGVMSLGETTAPSLTANYGKLYVKSADSKLYFMNDSGTEMEIGAAGGGASGSGSTTGAFTINTDSDNSGSDGGVNFQRNGSNVARFTAAGILEAGTGALATPALSFLADSDTGVHNTAADTVSMVAGGVEGLRVNTIASGVNYVAVTPAAAGAGPRIASAGADTNINLNINPKGTGSTLFTGSVGIGTTSAADALHVHGTSGYTSLRLRSSDAVSATAGSRVSAYDDVGSNVEIGMYNSGNPSSGGRGPGRAYIDTSSSVGLMISSGHASGEMRFYTGGTANANERIRILSTGNIGIGSTSPSAKLDVLDSRTDTSGTYTTTNYTVSANPASASTGTFSATTNNANANGTQNISSVFGSSNRANNNGSGTVTNLYGTYSQAVASGATTDAVGTNGVSNNYATATMTTGIGVRGSVTNNSTGTITTASAIYASPVSNASGTITNTYGVFIANQTAGTQTNAPYGLYQASATDRNYFAGFVGIGSSAPGQALDVTGSANVTGAYRIGGNVALTVLGTANIGVGVTPFPNINTGTAVSNVGVGVNAFDALTTGSSNTAIGRRALSGMNTQSYNTAVGDSAVRYSRGSNNTAVGVSAMEGVAASTPGNNTALGYRAGYAVTTGANNNILVGYQAADNLTTGANNLIIGYDVDAPSATANNQLNIGNLIFSPGIDGTGTTLSSGGIGIGTATPTTGTKLDIRGTGAAGSSIIIPRDTVANRPTTGVNGMMRYASDTNKFEAYQNGAWVDMIGGGGGSGDFLANGTVAMTGSFRAAGGTQAAPAISFAGDTDTGFWSTGDNNEIKISVNNNNWGTIGSNSFEAYRVIRGGNGAVNSPEHSFTGDNDTGMYSAGTNILGFSTGGTERIRIDASGNVGIGTTAATTGTRLDITGTGAAASSIIIPRDTVANRPTTGVNGMMRYATDTNKFEAYQNGAWVNMIGGGGGAGDFLADGSVNMTGTFKASASGSQSAPAITFAGGTNTGFYGGTGVITVTVNGNNWGHFYDNYLEAYRPLKAMNGDASDPEFGFSADKDNGMFYIGTNTFGFSTGGSERMRIDSSGNVGIGTTNPGYKLDVVGDIAASGCLRSSAGIASGTCVSDERLKTDIRPFDLGLEALLGINPHFLRYNGLGGHPVSDKPELGVIAQEVEKTAPQLIVTKEVKLNPEDGHMTEIKQVNYTAFTYVLINAVKDLYHRWFDDSQAIHRELASKEQEIVQLKADAAKQKQENAEMKARLDKIEKMLNSK